MTRELEAPGRARATVTGGCAPSPGSTSAPERLAIREALAFGKALYDVRNTLGLSVAELAMRASRTEDDIECIEEGSTEPTIPCFAASPPPQRRCPRHRRARPRLGLVRNPRRL